MPGPRAVRKEQPRLESPPAEFDLVRGLAYNFINYVGDRARNLLEDASLPYGSRDGAPEALVAERAGALGTPSRVSHAYTLCLRY